MHAWPAAGARSRPCMDACARWCGMHVWHGADGRMHVHAHVHDGAGCMYAMARGMGADTHSFIGSLFFFLCFSNAGFTPADRTNMFEWHLRFMVQVLAQHNMQCMAWHACMHAFNGCPHLPTITIHAHTYIHTHVQMWCLHCVRIYFSLSLFVHHVFLYLKPTTFCFLPTGFHFACFGRKKIKTCMCSIDLSS